jgi:hypothetical protein
MVRKYVPPGTAGLVLYGKWVIDVVALLALFSLQSHAKPPPDFKSDKEKMQKNWEAIPETGSANQGMNRPQGHALLVSHAKYCAVFALETVCKCCAYKTPQADLHEQNQQGVSKCC